MRGDYSHHNPPLAWDLRLPADHPPPLTPEERRAWLERDAAYARNYFAEHVVHPDAHTVAFSEMSAEAESELAAWDEMLHGRKA